MSRPRSYGPPPGRHTTGRRPGRRLPVGRVIGWWWESYAADTGPALSMISSAAMPTIGWAGADGSEPRDGTLP
jgi:hypothetical protein